MVCLITTLIITPIYPFVLPCHPSNLYKNETNISPVVKIIIRQLDISIQGIKLFKNKEHILHRYNCVQEFKKGWQQ